MQSYVLPVCFYRMQIGTYVVPTATYLLQNKSYAIPMTSYEVQIHAYLVRKGSYQMRRGSYLQCTGFDAGEVLIRPVKRLYDLLKSGVDQGGAVINREFSVKILEHTIGELGVMVHLFFMFSGVIENG